jgi:hypothetical protein
MANEKRAYTLYSLGRTLFEEAALAAVALWLLPGVGINFPAWLLILFMVAWAVYSYFTSRLVGKLVGRAAAVGPEALIGINCTTTTPGLFDYGRHRFPHILGIRTLSSFQQRHNTEPSTNRRFYGRDIGSSGVCHDCPVNH